MVSILRRFHIDPFILAIAAVVAIAAVFPATGGVADGLSWVTSIGIGLLFFLYGARMSTPEVLSGLKNWRLHLAILTLTFVLYPVVGILSWFAIEPLLGAGLAAGFLYLCLVPSTVQSSITFVAIAKGNVSGAIIAATLSNILGVLATPVLVVLLISTAGDLTLDGSTVWMTVSQLLLPFIAGQVCRPLVRPVLERFRRINLYDRFIILVVVYAAFSSGVEEGIWSQVNLSQIVLLVVACILLLVLMLGIINGIGRVLSFDTPDLRALQFGGLQKSLATGLPMAAVIFEGQPVGLVLLPLMLFHQIELVVGAVLAGRWGRRAEATAGTAPD